MIESRKTEMPPRMLRTQEAARFLGISLRTLEKHRTYGTGPTYRKIGGRVLYTVTAVSAPHFLAVFDLRRAFHGWMKEFPHGAYGGVSHP